MSSPVLQPLRHRAFRRLPGGFTIAALPVPAVGPGWRRTPACAR
ncbi:hypothetical protein [Kineosporia mesophila]|nr:hypothetical protein [Kineosporia mesophila]